MSRWTCALAAAVATGLLASPAAAQELDISADESPRNMALELHVGPYTPSIDSQFRDATPYQDVFGNDGAILFGVHADYQLWQDFGSVAVGGGMRYGRVEGTALRADGGQTTDSTTLQFIPLKADVIYRFDWPAVEYGVPFVPYAKLGLDYVVWWITNNRDEVANAFGPDGKGRAGRGGTFGWHFAIGGQLLLDFLEPATATRFDQETGVNNSYLFAEFAVNQVNDFGTGGSFDLSDNAFSAGLMFEF